MLLIRINFELYYRQDEIWSAEVYKNYIRHGLTNTHTNKNQFDRQKIWCTYINKSSFLVKSEA